MLQISSGKFYETDDPARMYVTVHRGVLYTNYSFLSDQIVTSVGNLLPSARWGDLQTIVCEVTERLPKPGGEIQPGDVISVGQDVLIQDFAAVVSFGLNVTCTPDRDLAQRLLVAQRPPLGIFAIPRKYVGHMFDASIPYQGDDIAELGPWIKSLINLERKAYTGIMRAIRRYVTAMHRIADDLDLAYALLVASIESLAQEFDGFIPTWEDLPGQKRKPVDDALVDVSSDVCDRVRQAILKSEHVALKRRFFEFSNRHLHTTFFRQEAKNQDYPAGRTELGLALKNAYDLRSEYIHALKPLPSNMVLHPSHADVQLVGSRPLLTLNGLARVARHVILAFIKSAPVAGRENIDYRADYPGTLRTQWAPEYWIHKPEAYSSATSRAVLNGFLSQLGSNIFDPSQKVTDLRLVMQKIETLMPSMKKPAQKMPMLLLYLLFGRYLPVEEQKKQSVFLQPHLGLFDQPSIDSLIAHFLVDEQKPDWSLETNDQLLKEYVAQRYSKNGLDAGPLIGAGLTLWVAEMHRADGNTERARELIAYGVDEYPQQKFLSEFERSLPLDNLPEIKWRQVLLAHLYPPVETVLTEMAALQEESKDEFPAA